MENNLKFALAGAMAAWLVAAPVSAQTNRIGGVVRDETGGTIRGAIVRAVTAGSGPGMSLTTATDDRGRFVFVVSRSGEWTISFEAPGFAPMSIPVGVRLAGPAPNLDVKLDRRETPEAFGALAGVDSKSLSSQLAAAAALMDEGRYDQALAAYREIKAKAPALSLVNLQIGHAHLAKKSYPDAEAAFQEILKADPAESNGLFAMGALREAQGNQAEARAWYEKAAAADPTWTRPLMKLAAMDAAAGDQTSASRRLTTVIDLDPDSPDGRQAQTLLKK